MDVGKRAKRSIRWGYLVIWVGVIALVVLVAFLRRPGEGVGPSILLVLPDQSIRTFDLSAIARMPSITREGEYQNQYGNWRDAGVYTGVVLVDLIGSDVDYRTTRVIAEDGFTATIDRGRVESTRFPMVLAYEMDGIRVPAWSDGYRIAVLPEGGRISNAEYDATSAGSYWVKNVVRIELQ